MESRSHYFLALTFRTTIGPSTHSVQLHFVFKVQPAVTVAEICQENNPFLWAEVLDADTKIAFVDFQPVLPGSIELEVKSSY